MTTEQMWTPELYRFDPDTYWEGRGGEGYEQSLSPAHAFAESKQRQFFRMVLDRFHPRVLLDFGFGSGRLFDLWSEVWQVYGIERSQSQLACASGRGFGYRLMLNRDSRSSVPFEDKMFDVAVACEVLNHVLPKEIPQLIAEFSRTMKEGGVLALVLAPPDHDFTFHSFNHDFRELLNIGGFVVMDDYVLPENKADGTGHSRYRYMLARNIGRKSLTDRLYYPHLFAGEGNGQGPSQKITGRSVAVQEDGSVQIPS